MRPSFYCQLFNSPFADPGLLVQFAFQKRSLLFDLGDLSAVPAADLLKADHIFVSHTHMDHFIGFDQILRIFLGRPKHLHLYGPAGFLKNVSGKLTGYTWNLVRNYEEALVIEVTEIEGECKRTQIFDCRRSFQPSGSPKVEPAGDFLYQEPSFKVYSVFLNHEIPCMAFCLQENYHINIIKNQMDSLGITVGPWLKEFKKLLHADADPATELLVPLPLSGREYRTFTIDELRTKIVRISRGQKIAYVTDAIYNDANADKIVAISRGADHLFIEAPFLEKDRDIAQAKYHLTARQAGRIARAAGVQKMTVFHHSPRYSGAGNLLQEEARQAFEGLI